MKPETSKRKRGSSSRCSEVRLLEDEEETETEDGLAGKGEFLRPNGNGDCPQLTIHSRPPGRSRYQRLRRATSQKARISCHGLVHA